jgi:hypothetical protein
MDMIKMIVAWSVISIMFCVGLIIYSLTFRSFPSLFAKKEFFGLSALMFLGSIYVIASIVLSATLLHNIQVALVMSSFVLGVLLSFGILKSRRK